MCLNGIAYKAEKLQPADPSRERLQVKIFFRYSRRMISAMHYYAAASITPYCNLTTSNLMATAQVTD